MSTRKFVTYAYWENALKSWQVHIYNVEVDSNVPPSYAYVYTQDNAEPLTVLINLEGESSIQTTRRNDKGLDSRHCPVVSSDGVFSLFSQLNVTETDPC